MESIDIGREAEKLREYLPELATYSKTCLKRPLKNRQNKDLTDKW